jgi:4-carboxymuconolactone decarboxylase
LTALYRPMQLPNHLVRAINNGVTKAELSEMITHVAFYAGWPSAVSAATIANDVLKDV